MNPKIGMQEEWRDVPGYEGLYQISISTIEGKCRVASTGYQLSNKKKRRDKRIYWTLTKNREKTTHQAARWIAITYPELIENEYFEGACVDHKDTNPNNNNPSNLHWVTYKGNMANPITKIHMSIGQTGRKHTEEEKDKIGKSQLNHKSKSKPVLQYSLNEVLINRYPSTHQAARDTGLTQAAICACCNRKEHYHTAGGFIWRYE